VADGRRKGPKTNKTTTTAMMMMFAGCNHDGAARGHRPRTRRADLGGVDRPPAITCGRPAARSAGGENAPTTRTFGPPGRTLIPFRPAARGPWLGPKAAARKIIDMSYDHERTSSGGSAAASRRGLGRIPPRTERVWRRRLRRRRRWRLCSLNRWPHARKKQGGQN
jgi:hypothetical protein